MASPVLSAHLAAIFREFRRSWLRAWSTTESPCFPQVFSRFFARIRGDRKCGEAVTHAEESYRRPQSSSRATDAGTTRGGEPVTLSTLGPRVESLAQSAKMGRRRTRARADPVAEAKAEPVRLSVPSRSIWSRTPGRARGAGRRADLGRGRGEGVPGPAERSTAALADGVPVHADTSMKMRGRRRDARPGTRRPIPSGRALHLRTGDSITSRP